MERDDDESATHADVSTAATEAAIDATIARKARGEHTPWDMACEMEDLTEAISDYAEILFSIGADHDLTAVTRVARDIKARTDEVEEWRGKLCHALHPRRHEPDFPDDGNGEVEEAEGATS